MRQFLFSRSGLVTLGFLAVAGYFLWTEHQAHVIAALPWLLVGGCLIMHLFMHGGHGGGHSHGNGGEGDAKDGSGRAP
jgi:hypothetical protein